MPHILVLDIDNICTYILICAEMDMDWIEKDLGAQKHRNTQITPNFFSPFSFATVFTDFVLWTQNYITKCSLHPITKSASICLK